MSIFSVLLPQDLSEVNREAFPYSFRLLYLVTLSAEAGGSLHTKFTVINEEPADTGRSFEFNALFHTYFSVHVSQQDDVPECRTCWTVVINTQNPLLMVL